MAYPPVNPAPTAIATRPGASAASVASAAAFVIGWRRLGISTAGPSPMTDVRDAASANAIHTSDAMAGESYNHAREYPSRSASTTRSGVSMLVTNAQEIRTGRQ